MLIIQSGFRGCPKPGYNRNDGDYRPRIQEPSVRAGCRGLGLVDRGRRQGAPDLGTIGSGRWPGSGDIRNPGIPGTMEKRGPGLQPRPGLGCLTGITGTMESTGPGSRKHRLGPVAGVRVWSPGGTGKEPRIPEPSARAGGRVPGISETLVYPARWKGEALQTPLIDDIR